MRLPNTLTMLFSFASCFNQSIPLGMKIVLLQRRQLSGVRRSVSQYQARYHAVVRSSDGTRVFHTGKERQFQSWWLVIFLIAAWIGEELIAVVSPLERLDLPG
jgi:hypothetical protein